MAIDQFTTPEEWRSVVGYQSLYEVSSYGQVRSLPRPGTSGRTLKQRATRWGYMGLKLYRDGQLRNTYAHLLVAAAFIGPRPPDLETRHLDGNPANNHFLNLKYGTKSENAQDRLRHGHHDQVQKTHCPKGHPYTPENTGIAPRKYCRYCKTCKREKKRAYWRRHHPIVQVIRRHM